MEEVVDDGHAILRDGQVKGKFQSVVKRFVQRSEAVSWERHA